VTVTVTFAITAALGSLTVPVRAPAPADCASANVASPNKENSNTIRFEDRRFKLFIVPPTHVVDEIAITRSDNPLAFKKRSTHTGTR